MTGTERNFSVIESDYLFRGQWEWDIQNMNGTNHWMSVQCPIDLLDGHATISTTAPNREVWT